MKWASATWRRRHTHPVLSLLLFLVRPAAAQNSVSPPPPIDPSVYALRAQFNPGMAAIVIAVISVFLILAFFSIYIRNRRDRLEVQRPHAGAGARVIGSAAPGLNPKVIESFPKFVYSEVKQHKIGKGALECAVCLSEFEDNDTLRFLPKCDHVFHSNCIDAWFAAHTTCPVCRTNFSQETATVDAAAVPPEAVTITVEEELPPLPPLPPGSHPKSMVPRSHSTGHSLSEDRERYTLRLPETIRRDVVAGEFTRSTSCYVGGEGRKGGRVGEIGGGGRSSFKTRTWERWASFKRSFSARTSRGDDVGTSGGASAVSRTSSKTKDVRNAEESPVNIRV